MAQAPADRLPLGFFALPLLWGVNFVAVKFMFLGMAPAAGCLLRHLLMIGPMLLLAKKMGAELAIERRDWLRLSIGGILSWAVYMPVFLEGMARTQPAAGAVSIATAPIFTAILAVLSRQDNFRWSLALGSLLSLSGVVVVETFRPAGSAGEDQGGAWLVLISAVLWAVGVVVTRPLYERYKSVAITAWSLVVSALPLCLYGLVPMIQTDWAQVGVVAWGGFFYFFLMAGIAGFAIYFSVVSRLGPSRAGLMQYIIPAVAALVGWSALGQAITLPRALGIGLVLAGVAIGVSRPGQSPLARLRPAAKG